jgi:hypothetical protein
MTPIDFGVKGSNGHIDLVGKNDFQSKTWQAISCWPSNFLDALVLARRLIPIDFGVKG